ncbi:HNH endonuclease [Mycobacterium sp. 94-17]|uniref:HNH endonuclease n=1 Tax=Mycobacterium sp. 94-17 TaxID=2986147 RepID=UPI003B6367DD
MNAKTCTVEENGVRCDRPHLARGYCGRHYHQLRNSGQLEKLPRPQACVIVENGEPCGKPITDRRGWCGKHYQRFKAHGDPLHTLRTPPSPTGLCSIPNCGKPNNAKGWCATHYGRWRNHGDPLWEPPPPPETCLVDGCPKPPRTTKDPGYCDMHYRRKLNRGDPGEAEPERILGDDTARFWSYVDKNGPIHDRLQTRCWLWTGAANDGRGQFYANGRHVLAHRYSLQIALGLFWPMYSHLLCDHRCHNERCVRPAHLRPVTHSQNEQNRRGPACNNTTSGIRGVYWDRRREKWEARLWHNGKHYHGGFFDSKEDAALARLELSNQIFTHSDVERHEFEEMAR